MITLEQIKKTGRGEIISYEGKGALEAVKENGYYLRYVKNQTPEICLEAVKENGYSLRYVKNQTPEICLEAVKQDGLSLQYVKNQTPEICLEAVKQYGDSLQYVDESIFNNKEQKETLNLTKQDLEKIIAKFVSENSNLLNKIKEVKNV